MKKYSIVYTNYVYVTVEAESEDEAIDKINDAEVDSIEGFQDPNVLRVENV